MLSCCEIRSYVRFEEGLSKFFLDKKLTYCMYLYNKLESVVCTYTMRCMYSYNGLEKIVCIHTILKT